jgi:hypothetical protein
MAKRRKPGSRTGVIRTGGSNEGIRFLLTRLGGNRLTPSGFPVATHWMSTLGSEHLLEKDGLQRFFYLIILTDRDSAVKQDDIQSFFRTGTNTNSDYVFVFVDLAGDDRLRQYLSGKPGGADLYQQIEHEAPVFLIADKSLTNKKDVGDVRLFPIRDYERDAAILYQEMGFESPSTRRAAIRFLKQVNPYFQLKPNISGIGINLNDMIADFLEWLERRSP